MPKKPITHNLRREVFRETKNKTRLAGRGSAAERGYGHGWRKIRARILAEHPLCAECEAKGLVVAATEVDHVIPRARGGGDDDGNLQPLCKTCHSRKTAREDGGYGR